MTSPWQESQRRLLHLMADRALFGLGAEEHAELQELLQSHPATDREMMDRLAARCVLAMGIDATASLPAGLRARIQADAERVFEHELR